MSRPTLSTNEVCTLLNVTETTIKRWADEGRIPCVKTLGGHRKFMINDIVGFAEDHAYPITGLVPPPMSQKQYELIQLGVQTRNYAMFGEVFLDKALQGDREGVYELLLYLAKHQIAMSAIADEVIRPAFRRVGEMWQSGRLEVHQEHRASHAVIEALIRIAPEIHRKPSNGFTAACASPGGDEHEIGLRCLSYSLEVEGWIVNHIGANTPLETMESFVKIMKPEVVCLSITIARRRNEFSEGIMQIRKRTKSYAGILIVGGYATERLPHRSLPCDYVASSIQDGVNFVRTHFELKPGPKSRKSAAAS